MAGVHERNGEGHNRIKHYPFPEGVPHPFLVALGVMDRQGAVVAAMRRKFVQINMLLSSIHDLLEFVQTQPGPFRVVDAGCGKGYLTFALASILGDRAEVIGIDSRDDVIATCRSVCERLAIKNLTFELGTIGSVDASIAPDLLISLHACNTATDVALFKAIQMNARAIAVAPCCQHELAPLIPKSLCSIIFGHPIMAQKAAALLTDAFRCELLSACGYDVKAIEFVDPEQTPKNILIKAIRTGVSRPLHEDFLKIRRQLSSGITLERLLVAFHNLDVT
jgi:SAM-dependent methyltransferase